MLSRFTRQRSQTIARSKLLGLALDHNPFEREDLRVVLCDMMVRRELASSENDMCRRQGETSAALLANYDPAVRNLREGNFFIY